MPPFILAIWAALKSVRISATVLIWIGVFFAGVVLTEGFERTFRLNLLFIRIEGLGVQLADLEAANAAALKAAEAKAQAVATAQAQATAKINAAYAAKIAAIQTAYQPALKEVPTYVTAKDDADCVINLGAQRLLDTGMPGAAAPSSAAGGGSEAPSALDLSGVVSADLLNHQAFDQAVAEAQAWRDWYAAQVTAWNATPSEPASLATPASVGAKP